MNRRHLLTTSFAFGALPVFAEDKPNPKTGEAPDVSKLDPAMGAAKATAANVVWHNPEQWGVEGRCWPDEPRKRYYDRLPASAEGKVPPAVWSLSRNSTGMVVRFKSNATDIH